MTVSKQLKKNQCSMIKKETHLAFYVRKTISMSFDTMTMSPVESINISIKSGMGVTSNSNTRWVERSLHIIHEFIYYMNLCIFLCIIHEFIYYMNLYFIRIQIMNLFPCLLCSLYTHAIALYSNSSSMLMKLAKWSNRRITSFENAAHMQLQTFSLRSKLSVCDDIVSECLYICNQNFDQRVHFKCVAISDEDWMLWNFYDKECDYMYISTQVPKFHDVHHMRVKTFSE